MCNFKTSGVCDPGGCLLGGHLLSKEAQTQYAYDGTTTGHELKKTLLRLKKNV